MTRRLTDRNAGVVLSTEAEIVAFLDTHRPPEGYGAHREVPAYAVTGVCHACGERGPKPHAPSVA